MQVFAKFNGKSPASVLGETAKINAETLRQARTRLDIVCMNLFAKCGDCFLPRSIDEADDEQLALPAPEPEPAVPEAVEGPDDAAAAIDLAIADLEHDDLAPD